MERFIIVYEESILSPVVTVREPIAEEQRLFARRPLPPTVRVLIDAGSPEWLNVHF
jgi:hypothetical protein